MRESVNLLHKSRVSMAISALSKPFKQTRDMIREERLICIKNSCKILLSLVRRLCTCLFCSMLIKYYVVYDTARVGKTSLSTKFVHGQFDKNMPSTVDASYLEK